MLLLHGRKGGALPPSGTFYVPPEDRLDPSKVKVWGALPQWDTYYALIVYQDKTDLS